MPKQSYKTSASLEQILKPFTMVSSSIKQAKEANRQLFTAIRLFTKRTSKTYLDLPSIKPISMTHFSRLSKCKPAYALAECATFYPNFFKAKPQRLNANAYSNLNNYSSVNSSMNKADSKNSDLNKTSAENHPTGSKAPITPHNLNYFLQKYGEIIRYLIIGIMTTLVSLIAYYSLTFTFLDPNNSFQLQTANVISWLISVTFAYFTNRSYVFRVKDKHVMSELIKFFSSRLFTLFVDMGMMFVFVSLLHLDDKIIKLIIQVIVIVLNYILSKFLVFIKPKSNDATSK